MSNPTSEYLNMENDSLYERAASAKLTADQFRRIGYQLIDELSVFLAHLPHEPIKVEHSADAIRRLIGDSGPPTQGVGEVALTDAARLLCRHAVSTSNPRFLGYIMGAASPVAGLSDLLASIISPPMTSYSTSALTVAMEAQTVRWIAEMIGYGTVGSGLFLSGGSEANLCAVQAALGKQCGFNVRTEGLSGGKGKSLCLYATREAHSSIVAAVEISGLGTQVIHWIDTDVAGRMKIEHLRQQILADREVGYRPFMVVGIAGTTTIGAVDPLPAIADLCCQEALWFHVDAAYGGFAVLSEEAPEALKGMSAADSVTVDPHKWLYMPADIGCLLTRHRHVLYDTFHQGASYYANDDEQRHLGGQEILQFRDMGPQTTRGFRALKVRIALQSIGTDGYRKMVTDDIRLAQQMYNRILGNPELEAVTNHLSITTFRYVPADLRLSANLKTDYLNQLNKTILLTLQRTGQFYPSHGVVDGKYVLRVCIVNFNTTLGDLERLLEVVAEMGQRIDSEQRSRLCGK